MTTPPPPPTRLLLNGAVVAEYDSGTGVEPVLSPRPYLHPVRTLAGTVVTEVLPEDHRHHLGVSIAVPDVSGTSFWGGRTFTPDRGSVLLDNHGRQQHVAWLAQADARRTELLSWTDPLGAQLLEEERGLAAFTVNPTTWALDVTMRLRNTSGRPLSVGSPATNGRPNAGYGGFFWRAPIAAEPPRCFGPDSEEEQVLHGSRADWLALAGHTPDGAPWTLVFFQDGPEQDPWFLRAQEYPGVGTSLALDARLPIATGALVERRIITLVADGHPGDAAALVAAARELI